MDALFREIFELSAGIRYVARASGQRVEMHQRPGLARASSGESDRYEELLVNPALVTLARQRGEIDCGGLECVIVGYGAFFQLVVPLVRDGHLSIAIEKGADVLAVHREVAALLARRPG